MGRADTIARAIAPACLGCNDNASNIVYSILQVLRIEYQEGTQMQPNNSLDETKTRCNTTQSHSFATCEAIT